MKKWYVLIAVVITLFVSACDDDGAGPAKKTWEEEVLLSDGSVIWVQRKTSYVVGSPMGGGGGYISNLENTLTVPANPVAPSPPVWHFESAAPMMLGYDKVKQTWYVVAIFYMCGTWVQWGWPMPPYRQYEVQNGQWVVVPLNPDLIGQNANLLTDIVGNKSKRVTIEDRIKLEWNSGNEYKFVDDTWNGCKDDRERN